MQDAHNFDPVIERPIENQKIGGALDAPSPERAAHWVSEHGSHAHPGHFRQFAKSLVRGLQETQRCRLVICADVRETLDQVPLGGAPLDDPAGHSDLAAVCPDTRETFPPDILPILCGHLGSGS
jgi:hypothetical protein